MSTELDVSWFDLKKYDAIAELDLSGWHTQLGIRRAIFEEINHDFDFSYSMFERIKENPKFEHRIKELEIEILKRNCIKKYPFNTHSVFSRPLTGICLFLDKESEKYKKEEQALKSIESIYNAEVLIDLTATDEQILSDFKYWLAGYRKHYDYESPKKNFIENDLYYWHELQVLPYIDLELDAAIKGKKLTQAKIAELLNQDLDRLRKTIKNKAQQLLQDETLAAIKTQLSSFKGNC